MMFNMMRLNFDLKHVNMVNENGSCETCNPRDIETFNTKSFT